MLTPETICNVPGIKVGHAQDFNAQTGCTVIIPTNGAVAGVDVRGSAPGTREIELLYPTRLVPKVDAILLTGGSAFGLDAAGGVQQFLEEKGIGYDTGVAKVPIVPTAVIYDLVIGNPNIRPDKKMGYQAAKNANTKEISEGNIGAGTGATVGKLAGYENAMKGGIGMCSIKLLEDVSIGVLVVVNALGNVVDPDNHKTIAGAKNTKENTFYNPIELLTQKSISKSFSNISNTTLGVAATNSTLTKEEATKVAQMANDGLARAIIPSHTLYDGDIIFALATGANKKVDVMLLGAAAAELMAKSIVRAVKSSNSIL